MSLNAACSMQHARQVVEPSESRGPEDAAAESLRRGIGELYGPEDLEDLGRGFGLCAPASCAAAGGRAGLLRVLFRLLFQSDAEKDGAAAAALEAAALPELGRDLNVSDWASAVPADTTSRMCLPLERAETSKGKAPLGARRQLTASEEMLLENLQSSLSEDSWRELWASEAEEDEPEPRLLGGGFEVPWWLGCEGPHTPRRWRAWARRARQEGAASGYRGPLSAGLLAETDALVEAFWASATHWVSWNNQVSAQSCAIGFAHYDLDTVIGTDTFSPYQYMLSNRSVDPRWSGSAEFRRGARFCPYGFMVALYVRALGQQRVGLYTSAMADLRFIRSMLGACNDLDLLDKGVWGIQSRDVDLQLFREEFPTGVMEEGTEPPRSPTSVLWGSPGPLARADDAHDAESDAPLDLWPPWRLDGRLALWTSLHRNAVYRQQLAEAAASSPAGAVAPRLAVLAWPDYFALFLVPMLLRLWPEPRLSILHLGPRWADEHDKCPHCMAEYGRRFVLDTPNLQAARARRGSRRASGARARGECRSPSHARRRGGGGGTKQARSFGDGIRDERGWEQRGGTPL